MLKPRPKPPEPDKIVPTPDPEPERDPWFASPQEIAEATRRWNEWSARTRREHRAATEKREEAERKARAESERRSRLQALLDRIPLVRVVDRAGTPLLGKYGLVEPWPWPGFSPIATPPPSSTQPDGVVEHRRRVLRYQALPSDSDEREDLAECCWQHGGCDPNARACPVCFPSIKRRRQREAERKARGGGLGFSFFMSHTPPEPREPRIY